MTISVLIPAYNAASTIESTLVSVLSQTQQPDEIIVLVDGATDNTLERVQRFKDRVTVLCQENHGSAITRNKLVAMAKGEIIAFVDSDDLWHPKYLETQLTLLRNHPRAVVSFVGHTTFTGADYVWREEPAINFDEGEPLCQVEFFRRYNISTGEFGSPSFACIRKSALQRLGPEPFQCGGVCDVFLFYQIALVGEVVLLRSPLAAYRVIEGSISSNRLNIAPLWVEACEKLEPQFRKSAIKGLREAFTPAYAGQRRYYAKLLLGAGRADEARRQLICSMANCFQPVSVGKSFALWAASWLPSPLQPAWPSAARGTAGYSSV